MYSVNDKVVYPGHGVAIVTQIINKTVGSESLSFYELSFINKEITVLVPVKNFAQIGIRSLAQKEEIEKLFENFCLHLKVTPHNHHHEGVVNSWNKRHKQFQSKLRSGFLTDLGSVYFELKHTMNQKELSFGERTVLQQTEHLLAEEISLVLGVGIAEACEMLSLYASQNIMPKKNIATVRG